MVLAGPGSGKTLTIVKRIEYLIKTHKVKPEDILVVTFTKAAAGEMRERFYCLMKNRQVPVTFGTFHSIFYGILKWAYHLSADNFLNEQVQFQLIGQICESRHLECDREMTADILGEIGRQKSQFPQRDISSAGVAGLNAGSFRSIQEEYENKKTQMGRFDFDDMLVKCCQLFQDHPEILAQWQDRFSYVLIDEFQDINPVQYEVMRMLCDKHRNLFVVGDDDQSIYRFRGAEPAIMLGFQKDYPEAVKIVLDINFRSSAELVSKAEMVIGANQNRFQKHIRAQREGGDRIQLRECADVPAESRFIVKKIGELAERGIKPEETAVLFRSKADVGCLVEILLEFGIPFYMKEQINSIYEHFIGRDITSYIKLALGGKERADFLRIGNRPNRYIKRDSLDDKEITFESLRWYYEDQEWMLDHLDEFEEDVRMLAKMAPYAAVAYIRKRIGYDCFLREYAAQRRIKEESLFSVLDELEERAKNYQSSAEWLAGITLYNQHLQEEKRKRERTREGVRLMSMHGAKGLEFDAVFIIGANEGGIPHKKAALAAEIEEERRVFYVAVTRARQQLSISYVKEKNGKEQCPSRFIEQLSG